MDSPRDNIVTKIEKYCPEIKAESDSLASEWLTPVHDHLESGKARNGFPKVFNDPIWGTIELMPWEIVLLDSPLLQRLRGVRQLGLAHFVYPSACHDRLEHVRGVVEAADRMISRLERNATHRKSYGARPDHSIPSPQPEDRFVVRLAALLHDLGHGPFSHAIEPVIEQRYKDEFRKLGEIFREELEGTGNISVSEAIAALVVLSEPMATVLNHSEFNLPSTKVDLQIKLVARIVGSRSHLSASYLSGIVSGPVDADKLDYMARDSYHAGLPLGVDTERLISKLEIITITPENVPANMGELRVRAESAERRRIYEMGISLSGIGAYEQMMIGRVLLYDRLYYHHKVRAADAMAQRLIDLAEQDQSRTLTIKDLFFGVSDDTMIAVLGGLFTGESEGQAADLARRIQSRRLYHRSLAFAARFIAGLEGLPDKERDSARGALWRQVTKGLATIEDIKKLESSIYETAIEVSEVDDTLKILAKQLKPEHIIVDLPLNKAKPSGNLLLTRTGNDEIGLPNLFFDPERWSNAYDQQKRCGYIFCPREQIPLVSLAAKVALFRIYRIGLSEGSERYTKTSGSINPDWIDKLAESSVIDKECHEQLRKTHTRLALIRTEDILLPDEWKAQDPNLVASIARELQKYHPGGFVPSVRDALLKSLNALAHVVKLIIEGGEFSGLDKLDEVKQLQSEVRKLLRAQTLKVLEGSEFGGGESDLLLEDCILVENKVAGTTDDVMATGQAYPFQARRYGISLCTSVFFTFVAYKPKSEAGILPQHMSVQISKVPAVPEDCLEIRMAVPFGTGKPSAAKPPPSTPSRTGASGADGQTGDGSAQ